jgi:HAD superfamily hydrolase (TIGR01490 family)
VTLALFDLDNTLLAGDSDYLWGRFLIEQGIVDGDEYEQRNQAFYDQYRVGRLDIHEFLAFQLQPLAAHSLEQLQRWRQAFLERMIEPIILPAARELVARHRLNGDTLVIVTATNRFITEPIAARFGVDHLLATEVEMRAGRYTGRAAGTPCFRHGKVERLEQWLATANEDLAGSWFYTDSHNDLPLLERVTNPIAVDPDETLRTEALARNWTVISLRTQRGAEP